MKSFFRLCSTFRFILLRLTLSHLLSVQITKGIFVPEKCFRKVLFFFSTGHRRRASPLKLKLTLHKTGEDGNFLRHSQKDNPKRQLGRRANESSSNRNEDFSLLPHTDCLCLLEENPPEHRRRLRSSEDFCCAPSRKTCANTNL